jgi:hypothetical protein
MELERGGRIDELLRPVEHLVRLIRVPLEIDVDLGGRVVVGDNADACRDNITALEIDLHADQRAVLNLGFHDVKCPQNLSVRVSVVPSGAAARLVPVLFVCDSKPV